MKVTFDTTDEAILSELGSRFARVRLDRNLTQAQLAERAHISKRTVERLESGSVSTRMSGLIRVCRALGTIERFDLLVPEPVPSPIEQLRLHGQTRRRAARQKKSSSSKKKWNWGDEG